MTLFRAAFSGAPEAKDDVTAFGTNTLPTPLTARNDITTSDAIMMPSLGMIDLGGDFFWSYEEIVKRQLWVRIAVNKLAYTIGRLPLKTYTLAADGSRQRAGESPLAQLLRKPNDSKEHGHPAGFKARIAADLFTFGNAIIVKIQRRPDEPPTQLIPYSPRGWSVQQNGAKYVYRDPFGGEPVEFDGWRIIHLIEPGPTIYGFGISRLEAARLTLSIEYAAQRLGAATFKNGARPSSMITVPRDQLPASEKDRLAWVERFKSEIKSRFGGVDNAGLPAILEGSVNWQTQSWNLDEAAVVAHRQLTRMEVAALYDIPQPAIGILDNANFASVDALHLMFYQDSLGWPINLIEDAFQQQLIDGVPAFEGQYLEFDLNAVMRGSFAQRMQGYQAGIRASIYTSDEVRAWENLPPKKDEQPEADLLQFPVNYSVFPEPPRATTPGAPPPPASDLP